MIALKGKAIWHPSGFRHPCLKGLTLCVIEVLDHGLIYLTVAFREGLWL